MDRLRRLADEDGDANDADDHLDPATVAVCEQIGRLPDAKSKDY